MKMIPDTYPPALRRMITRRDRAQARGLDWVDNGRRRHRSAAKAAAWLNVAARLAVRIASHPHFRRPVKSTTTWADLAEGPKPGMTT